MLRFVLALVFVTVDPVFALPMASRSVRSAISDEANFPSGFSARACEDALGLLEASVDGFAALDLRERIRRLHGLAYVLSGSPKVTNDLSKDLIPRLAELATVDTDQLMPFGHELLVLIARLGSFLRDRPDRSRTEYYGVRAFVERVVNLRHKDTQRDHALIAFALARLADLRVSRLSQVARFDDDIREAFEDLDRLQREDALGDNDFLRLHGSLTVFARVIPAFTMYDEGEQGRRAVELLERLNPVEDAVRALVSRRYAADDPRVVAIVAGFGLVLGAVNMRLLPAVEARVRALRSLVLNRPVNGGSPAQR